MGFLGFSGLGEPPKQIVSGSDFFTASVSRLDRPSEDWGLGSRRNKFVSMTFFFVFYIVVRLRSRLSVHPTVSLVLNHSSIRLFVQLHASETNLLLRFSFLCRYAAFVRPLVRPFVRSFRSTGANV